MSARRVLAESLTSLLLASVWAAGCVVLPEPLPIPVADEPLIHINKNLLEPSLDDTAPVDRGDLAKYDVRTAVEDRDINGPLRYAWYSDFDPTTGIPVQNYVTCAGAELCVLAPCKAFISPLKDSHKLLLVVSEAALKSDVSTNPFDFPKDTAYDWVEWQVELTGDCP